ncbi:MAG TPA: hypothetical protein VGE01_00465 [Fimbriimonas sp.]
MSPLALAAMELLSRVVDDCREEGVPEPNEGRWLESPWAPVRAAWSRAEGEGGGTAVQVAINFASGADESSLEEASSALLLAPFVGSLRLSGIDRALYLLCPGGSILSQGALDWAQGVQSEIESQQSESA